MKKLIFLFVTLPSFLLLAFSCGRIAERAKGKDTLLQEEIAAYLSGTLGDPGSYEPVSFERTDIEGLDTATVEYQQAYAAYLSDTKAIDRARAANNALGGLLGLQDMLQQADHAMFLTWYTAKVAKGEAATIPVKVVGHRVRHTYRARNSFNALVLHRSVFIFDEHLQLLEMEEADD